MTKHNRIARGVLALVLCLATFVTSSVTASAAPEAEAKAKLHATLLDSKVKVNEKARIKGVLDIDSRSAADRTLEPIVVQRLVAGVWVNVYTTDCRPNYTFRLNISFSISAQYQLRVYSPTTTVFSSTLLLNVVL
jgi:hypothetical protein